MLGRIGVRVVGQAVVPVVGGLIGAKLDEFAPPQAVRRAGIGVNILRTNCRCYARRTEVACADTVEMYLNVILRPVGKTTDCASAETTI